jgi:integrase/recombinase XerC
MNDYLDSKVNDFLMYMKIEKGCSNNTIKGYKHDLTTLIGYLCEMKSAQENEPVPWETYSTYNLRSFINYLGSTKQNKSSSIHRRVCSLKAFFKFLKENELINKDPAEGLSYPKRDKSLPKFLPTKDIKTLMDSAHEKAIGKSNSILHKTVLEVLYSTGARCNEIRNMDLNDVDIISHEYIDESGVKREVLKGEIMIRGGKGSKDRLVLLTPRAAEILRAYIATERKSTLNRSLERNKEISEDARKALFLSNRGQRVANRTIQHFISEMSKYAGVRHTTPHMIRHSFASHLVMNKTNIRAIQKLLGHSSLDTTQIYANISDDFLKTEFEGNLPFK